MNCPSPPIITDESTEAELRAYIALLEDWLELTTVSVIRYDGNGEPLMETRRLSPQERAAHFGTELDGIGARDEAIKLLDEQLGRLRGRAGGADSQTVLPET